MDSKKFDQMVREFPFIKQVITRLPSFTGDINDVIVKKVDRNLLEVRPGGHHHDGGSVEHSGYRHFWCVAPGELVKLESGQWTTRVPHGTRINEVTAKIGTQLIRLNRDVQYIVEASDEQWDWEDPNPTITIYKMGDLDWRQFASIRQDAEEESCSQCGYFECVCSECATSVSDRQVAEFKRIIAKALARVKQERPRVVVPAYARRSKDVEQILGGKAPELYFDVISYVADVRHPEAHREAVMVGWLTGYGSVPKLS